MKMSVPTAARRKVTTDPGARGSVTQGHCPGAVSKPAAGSNSGVLAEFQCLCGQGPHGPRFSLHDEVGLLFPTHSLPSFSWFSPAPTWHLQFGAIPPGMECFQLGAVPMALGPESGSLAPSEDPKHSGSLNTKDHVEYLQAHLTAVSTPRASTDEVRTVGKQE